MKLFKYSSYGKEDDNPYGFGDWMIADFGDLD